MTHVQTKRAATVEVRKAKEKGCVAVVCTASGLHSDVYVLTVDEWAALVAEGNKAAKK